MLRSGLYFAGANLTLSGASSPPDCHGRINPSTTDGLIVCRLAVISAGIGHLDAESRCRNRKVSYSNGHAIQK